MYKATSRTTGRQVAVKDYRDSERFVSFILLLSVLAILYQFFHVVIYFVAKEGEGISQTAVREVALLRELRHENIVKLAGVYVDPVCVFSVFLCFFVFIFVDFVCDFSCVVLLLLWFSTLTS